MTLEGADFFDHQYSNFDRRFLNSIGLSPYQRSWNRFHHVSFVTVFSIVGVLFQFQILLTPERNAPSNSELLQTLLPTLTFVLRYYTLLCNLKTIKKSLDYIRNDWKKLMCDEELIIMKEYANISRLYCRVVECIIYLYNIILIFPSLLSIILYFCDVIDDKQLLLPVNNEAFVANKLCFFFAFLLELVTINVFCKIGTSYCAIFILCIQHICAMFDIVTIRINQLFKKRSYEFCELRSDSNELEKEYVWIITAIRTYNDVINFVEMIKLLYKSMYFLDVVCGFFCVILDFVYVFQILKLMVTLSEGIKNCVYIIGSTLIIYTYAYCGQTLIDYSNKIFTECCLIPFYTLSIKTNKLLIILTMRSTKPCYFSINGVAIASHSFFAKLIKISFSFATLYYNID